MARIRSYRVGWDPSPDADVAGYVVCWAIPPSTLGDGSLPEHYDIPTKIDVGNITSVNLPLAGMPSDFDGDIHIGVCAYDDVGNQSDIIRATIPLDLVAPNAPSNLRLL